MRVHGSQVFPVSVAEVLASSVGTSVSDGGSAGTFSASFTQLVASLANEARGFWLATQHSGSYFHEIKLYAGAAAAEVEFAHLGSGAAAGHPSLIYVPQVIPAGTRVSAKVASDGGFAATNMHIIPARANGDLPLAGVGWLVGTTSASPVTVDAGATANTKSSWVQVVSSSHATRNAKGFSVCFAGDATCDTSNVQLWDFAIGGSGSEQVILANVSAGQESYRAQLDPIIAGPFWTPIPAGSRLAARVQSTTNGASSRAPRVALILWG